MLCGRQKIIWVLLIILVLVSCGTGKSRYEVSMDAFDAITPGKTNQETVQDYLGKPAEIMEDGQSVYWDYDTENNPEGTLRIAFDTNTTIVIWMEFYNQGLLVADLIDRYGEPVVVFQTDVSPHGSGDFYRSIFAYPETGIHGIVHSYLPTEQDEVFSLLREEPRDSSSLLFEIEESSLARVLEWP